MATLDPAHSVHSVRSTIRHSVTFAAAELSSSASDSVQDKELDRPIVSDPNPTTTERPAENSPALSKRSSLLKSSFNASKRTLGRLKRKKTGPVTVTEEIIVERVLHPGEPVSDVVAEPRDSFTTESVDSAETPSSLGARRHAFAKLARAAFTAPGKVASRASSLRTHRRRSARPPEPVPPVPPLPPPAAVQSPAPTTPSAPESTVAPATTPTTPGVSASSPDPQKPKFRAKLNRLWHEQCSSRVSLPQHRPPSHSAETLGGDSALFPFATESSGSRSRLKRISSRFSRRSNRTRSRSTVHLERITTLVTAQGEEVIHPQFFRDSPVSEHSELYPDSSAPASRRQSWWASASQIFHHSRLPSTATLPDGLTPDEVRLAEELLRTAGVSRPVSEALFPSDFADFLSSATTPAPNPKRKPKLSIVTAGTSKGEPQQKTPRSILKSPSRAFFRRYSSPPPPPPPPPVPVPVATSTIPQSFFFRASQASLHHPAPPPAPSVTQLASQSAQLFPLAPLSPPPAFEAQDYSASYFDPSPTPDSDAPPPAPAHEFFFPSEKPSAHYAPDLIPIPITVEDENGNPLYYIENQPDSTQQVPIPIPVPYIPIPVPASSSVTDNSKMGAKDWEDEGITFAEEEEYDSTQYFRDRPPPREPAAPRTASTIYQPLPGVIEQNELLLVSLSNAHSALWKRYQDYGQMGVFGWTADFSDMIDALKTLGFEGNMFVSTRQAALEACVRILRLRIDIKMQIITIYLCNQVSRLRRFLDADKQWDDYPPIDFPLDPYSEGG